MMEKGGVEHMRKSGPRTSRPGIKPIPEDQSVLDDLERPLEGPLPLEAERVVTMVLGQGSGDRMVGNDSVDCVSRIANLLASGTE